MQRPVRCLRARMWCRDMACDVTRVLNCARISRPVTPHVLRHTFAVTAIQKGISLPALQRLLGHDRPTTTEIYLNLSPEEVVREFREKW
jgi:integrase/recombinase XerD